MREIYFLHIFASFWYHHFFMWAILTGTMWYLIVVFICSSLVVDGIKYDLWSV